MHYVPLPPICCLPPIFMWAASLAAIAYFLLRAEPMPGWLLSLLAIFVALDGWFIWRARRPPAEWTFEILWWIAVAELLLFPVVIFREGRKRGLFQRSDQDPPDRPPRRKPRQRRPPEQPDL